MLVHKLYCTCSSTLSFALGCVYHVAVALLLTQNTCGVAGHIYSVKS